MFCTLVLRLHTYFDLNHIAIIIMVAVFFTIIIDDKSKNINNNCSKINVNKQLLNYRKLSLNLVV